MKTRRNNLWDDIKKYINSGFIALKESVTTMASIARTAAGRLGSRHHNLLYSIPSISTTSFSTFTTNPSSFNIRHPVKLTTQSFSSTNLPPQTDETKIETPIEPKTYDSSSPRFVLDTLPESFTPGQALFVLQKKGGDGNLISKSDLTRLCEAARSGKAKDAKIIRNALIQFQSCWKLQLKDPALTSIAIDSMLLAVLKEDFKNTNEEEKAYFADSKVKAGLLVAEAFTKRETGLYYSMKIEDIEKFLTILWEGLQEHSMNIAEMEDGDEEKEEKVTTKYLKREEPARLAALYLINPDRDVPRRRIKKRARYLLKRIFGNMCLPKYQPSFENPEDILKVTKEVFYTLLIRSAVPEQKMKKKAKRAYLKKLIVADDPTEETVELIANICGYVGGSSKAKEIVDMWEKKLNSVNRDGSEVVDISKLSALVEAWEQREEEQKESVEDDIDSEGKVEESVKEQDEGSEDDDKKD